MPESLVVALIYAIISTAVSYAVSTIIASANNGQREGNQPKDPGVRAQVPPDTTTPVPIVYGSAYLGGRFVDGCLRTDQQVMYYVHAISCISDNGQFSYETLQFYYGDRKITFDPTFLSKVTALTDGAGNVDTSINDCLFISLYTSDKYGNITAHNTDYKMPWEKYAPPGHPETSVLMGVDSGLPTEQQWTSTGRRMNGLAFAIIRLSYNRDAGTTQLQPITYHVTQKLNGTGAAKPGDVWYDYMTNAVYGAAIDAAYVDSASRTALNLYADELITFNDYNGNPSTQPRYRINGVIDAGQSVLQNIDHIMTACDSWLCYDAFNGKWSVKINRSASPVMNFNDDNLIGPIDINLTDITQTPNQIEAKFPDSANRDQYNYVFKAVPSELLSPNEPENKLSTTYELVNDSVQALYLANRILEQNREDLNVTITTTYDGIQVEAGDVVTITNSAYGWNLKQFRVMQVKEICDQEGNLHASMTLYEYNAQVYDNFDITQYTPAGNTGNPSSGYFSSLSAPAVVNQRPYISVPAFDINCAIPVTGRTTFVTLFYSTYASPTNDQWLTLGTKVNANSAPFASGAVVTYTNIVLPAATYYFAYKVGNESFTSPLSSTSLPLVWAPDPANASSFTLTFNPATLQVPYSGTPSFAGVTCKLYGQNGLGGVDFVPAQDDSDVTFIAGTWRIGNSDSTGYTDIVETNITVPDPTDGGTHADFGQPTAMPSSTASMQVPVRYKDLAGVIHQVSPATIQYVYSTAGTSADKYATGYLYQWSTVTPGNPSGTSIYTWSDGSMSSYTGGNSWETSIAPNPGIPGIKLWQASKQIHDVATVLTTTVSWASGYSIADVTQNGAAGTQAATPTVYQWALTIPSGPTGTSTYTWATSSFTPVPSGWSDTPGTSPSPGYTLWGASVQLTDSATATTSSINWTTASITARGYSGQTGGSARVCYTKTTLSSLDSTPTTITTSGSSSYPPDNSWGTGTVWQATPPSITAGESVYQSDGIYSPTTGNTIWNVPYLSALKVGSLSAISANLGTITAGSITGVTITGSTIQTSASGSRIAMTYSNNLLTAYGTDGTTVTAQMGGTSGSLYAKAATTLQPAVYGQSNADGGSSGVNVPAIYGYNAKGDGVQGWSAVNGIGVYGAALITGATNHGVRGVNRATTGGTQTGGLVGVSNGYDFYADGGGTNYGPFTGAHDVMVAVGSNIEQGYIVKDVKCLIKKNISNTVFEVALSNIPNQPCIGIMVVNNGLLADVMIPAAFIEKYDNVEVDGKWEAIPVIYPEYDLYKNDYDYCSVNAVGEGQVYVCGENGDIAVGDLIVSSSIAGVGMKQADDIVKNYTVAKAREAVIFDSPTDAKLVACIYLCG